MAGATDLGEILRSLRVSRRDEPVTMVAVDEVVGPGPGIAATIGEAEGLTVVATVTEAERRGWPVEFLAAWLTIDVHTSLEAVGLTAALSTVLAERGIACNVVAAYHHDHLLVPLDRVDEAIEAIRALAAGRPR